MYGTTYKDYRMVRDQHKLTVRISEIDYRPVRVKAAELGRPVSEIVSKLLSMWVEGEIDLPPPMSEQEGE